MRKWLAIIGLPVALIFFLLARSGRNEPVEHLAVAHLDPSDRENLRRVLQALATNDIDVHVQGGIAGVLVDVDKEDAPVAKAAVRDLQLATEGRCIVRLIDENGVLQQVE